MNDIHGDLQQLRVVFPEEPDLATAVVAAIPVPTGAQPPWRRVTPVAVTVALAVIVMAGAIPSWRAQVAAWLGIESLVIAEVSDLDALAAERIDIIAVSTDLAGAEARAGFAPLFSDRLGPAERIYAAESVIWYLYGPNGDLPPSAFTGVGAVVTQWPAGTGAGALKSYIAQVSSVEVVMVNGEPAFWFDGPHTVELFDAQGATVERRSAGPTLIWQTGEHTVRLESGVDQSRAIELAESFR